MMRASSLRKPVRVQKPASVMDGNNISALNMLFQYIVKRDVYKRQDMRVKRYFDPLIIIVKRCRFANIVRIHMEIQ